MPDTELVAESELEMSGGRYTELIVEGRSDGELWETIMEMVGRTIEWPIADPSPGTYEVAGNGTLH